MNAVEFEHVSKSYAVYDSPAHRLAELAAFGFASGHRDFSALNDVSFSVARGETFCIVGENGSGKSTALQLMTGILAPTSGTVRVNGRVAALLELGSGFNPEFTGRENVRLNAAILGLNSRELDARFESIADFAQLGDFMERPVRTYSSGMAMRLAFSVAIHTDPEILIVDEALAVGDAWFRRRCFGRIAELRDRGVTIIFVSHSAGDVRAIGDRAMWLDHGRIRAIGPASETLDKYLAASAGDELPAAREAAPDVRPTVTPLDTIPNIDHREGDGAATILGTNVFDEFGDPLHLLIPGCTATARITFRAARDLRNADAGVLIRNHLGLDFAAASASKEQNPIGPVQAGALLTVDFRFDVPELYPGAFSFTPWVADCPASGGMPLRENLCDKIENAVTLQMARGALPVYGFVQAPCRVESGGSESA